MIKAHLNFPDCYALILKFSLIIPNYTCYRTDKFKFSEYTKLITVDYDFVRMYDN